MRVEDVKKLTPFGRLAYWVREREAVRLKKEAGTRPPWTDDELLGTYRFCNARRMDDKVSRWLLENWYVPHYGHPNMLFAAALARFVNLPSSLGEVTHLVFRDRGKPPDWASIKPNLRNARDKFGVIFNGAYMVRGNTTKSADKVATVVDEYIGALVERAANPLAPEGLVQPDSMEWTHHGIAGVYGFGSFMAGQVVADLRHAVPGEWADRHVWAPVGPGSSRGMNRLHGREVKPLLPQEQFGRELKGLITALRPAVGPGIMDRLEAHDVQNCLCEFDKYERALWGEGKPKQLYKPSAADMRGSD